MSGSVDTLPTGFRRSLGSGLIVPEEVSRERQVWTWQEWRDLERTTKRLTARGMAFLFRCEDPRCQGKPIERVRMADGGISLRCNHADRVFLKTI